ncbi:MAG: DUF1492 domain-containing protein [Phycisphaerae bacterium]|nr:DUF1492 domain-containing protein [Phycisphaerae bacterium]MDD5239956.1 DUF1492 domain-containing protein [Candidatus Nanoarchaeia archaeon]
MTEKDLKQIRGKLREMEAIKRQMEARRYRLADSVRGSMPVFPYVEHVIAVTGIRDRKIGRQLSTQKELLKEKIKEVLELVRQANEYIDTIPDADTRIILRCRYVNCMTWYEIETDFGISISTGQRRFREWQKKDPLT